MTPTPLPEPFWKLEFLFSIAGCIIPVFLFFCGAIGRFYLRGVVFPPDELSLGHYFVMGCLACATLLFPLFPAFAYCAKPEMFFSYYLPMLLPVLQGGIFAPEVLKRMIQQGPPVPPAKPKRPSSP